LSRKKCSAAPGVNYTSCIEEFLKHMGLLAISGPPDPEKMKELADK
jgi:hypothetical protein